MHKIPDIEPFKQKLSSLDEQMAAADFFSDAKKATEVSREHQRLSSLIEKFEQYHKVEQQLIDNEGLLTDSSTDQELVPLIEEEQLSLKEEKESLVLLVLKAMVPPDSSDSRNSVMEIRGGAGGDEANMFAGDLLRMYSGYAEKMNWRVELMSSSAAETGGFREIIFKITGENVYKH